MPDMKKKSDKNDKIWNVVSFDRESRVQPQPQVSVELVTEEGLCDDILSNASSDESELPASPLKQSNTELSFGTLVGRNEDEDDFAAPERQEECSAPKTGSSLLRAITTLKTWHVVVLTSSTTLFLTYVVQSFLYNQATELGNETATVPYFTDHGASYRNVDFVLPFGDISENTSKFIVDFENRVAIPILAEVSPWQATKFQVNQKAACYWKGFKSFCNEHAETLSERFSGAGNALKNTLRRSGSLFAGRLGELAANFEPVKASASALGERLVQNYKDCDAYYRNNFPMCGRYIRGKAHGLVGNTRSLPRRLGALKPTLGANLRKALSTSDRIVQKADLYVLSRWNNTIEMLRFKKKNIIP
ncbi:KLTH0E07106p [Lachancea thermotolerans CBS 6340]|uniref:KLTH0E07106p n=1 Tax=Lachancea thermotolerans (strain ATCC 56472 / CBS 6340 / NRRL Y-8284) TaxID=559295 RepID=C5DHU1_LACTC|nr:KLTH0E07106p [Lachancea thermotolerans CBS 6340]CAR23352.1 KLTH0E07106p [Lachancea thermotolerans CBS 6340]